MIVITVTTTNRRVRFYQFGGGSYMRRSGGQQRDLLECRGLPYMAASLRPVHLRRSWMEPGLWDPGRWYRNLLGISSVPSSKRHLHHY